MWKKKILEEIIGGIWPILLYLSSLLLLLFEAPPESLGAAFLDTFVGSIAMNRAVSIFVLAPRKLFMWRGRNTIWEGGLL